jgi:hypothetical protein
VVAEEEERSYEIPTEFSLRELHQEAKSTADSRRDFIEKRIAAGKAIAPSKHLALYSLARLDAIVRLLAQLHNEEVRQRKQAQDDENRIDPNRVVEDDGF